MVPVPTSRQHAIEDGKVGALAAGELSVSWPVWAHNSRWAWRLESVHALRTARSDHLRRGELLDLRLIDIQLNFFKVVDVRVLGRAGIFGWRPGFKGVYFRVDPVIRFERRLTLEQAKDYMIEFISSHPDAYEGAAGVREALIAVSAASTFGELLLAAQ
jgi:hypothetical protein